MSTDLERLAYEAAVRALDKQEEVLSEIRARTGMLLAVSSLAVSFLGRSAIERAHVLVVAAAIVAFAISIGASLYILFPKENLVFALSGPAIVEGLYDIRGDPTEIHRRLAYDLHRFWERNDTILAPMFGWFRRAVIAVAVEIVVRALAVSDTLVLR